MSNRIQGTVAWFDANKGFGMIMPDGENQNNVFVHFAQIQSNTDIVLNEGQRVEFGVEIGQKGPAAIAVVLL